MRAVLETLRDYLNRVFSPRPSGLVSHAHCVDRERLVAAHGLVVDLQQQLELLRKRNAQMEQRWESAEARATEYGQRLAELKRLAMPVSLLLVEGDIESACAVNPLLWEAVKPEASEA